MQLYFVRWGRIMIDKKDLLLKASTESDEERFKKIIEYDMQQGGVMLYRYRHLSDDTRNREIKALICCKIWASNPKCFDDDNEFLPTSISKRDYACMRYFFEKALDKEPKKTRRRKMAEIDKLLHSDGRTIQKIFLEELKKARSEYAVSCFTENSPCDTNHNMWKQYAKDSGICLGYSLMTLVKAGVIIDPVYYMDSKEKSLGNMFELFGRSIRTALCFCVKEKYGYDKYDKDAGLICWSDQNEWRYAIQNTIVDKSKKEYAMGCNLDGKIVPDVVYVKNLDFWCFLKVWLAAKLHGIAVKRIA